MSTTRQVQKVIRSKPTIEGAGVHLKRAFGFAEAPGMDPFLLLDDFRSCDPRHYVKGFPWHPHRGIETITYVLEGRVAHGDSMGHQDVITAGAVQWMTAGSGLIHQEMPEGDPAGCMGGFQLWANLPAVDKMMEPRYRAIGPRDLPIAHVAPGIQVTVISGTVAGVHGPVRDVVIDPELLDVSMAPDTTFLHPTRAGHTVLAYVFDGRAAFCPESRPFDYDVEGANYFDFDRGACLGDGALVLYGDGDEIRVTTGEHSARFLLMSGRPLREPVAWYGPIVMNSRAELETAFREYREGTFIRHADASAPATEES